MRQRMKFVTHQFFTKPVFKAGFFILAAITLLCFFSLSGGAAEKLSESAGEKIINVNNAKIHLKGNATYRISLDSNSFSRELPQRHMIRLTDREFDPLNLSAKLSRAVNQPVVAHKKGLFIVQCVTQAIEAYQKEITTMGGMVVGTLPEQALLVIMKGSTSQQVGKLNYVRWVGPYKPEYKMGSGVKVNLSSTSTESSVRYSILIHKKWMRELVKLAIEAIGGKVELLTKSRRMEATLTTSHLQLVLLIAEVLHVDLWSPAEDDMNIVRQVSGAGHLESVAGYTGQGVRGEVMDDGIRATHTDFQANSPIFHNQNNTSDYDHGTKVYSIVFGSGAGDSNARGLLSDAEQPIMCARAYVSDRYAHTEELVNPSGSYRAVFQTNSWGNTRTRTYTTYSSEMDEIIFDLDILILQSQSNEGNQDSRPQAWAKNILSIGGLRHYDTADRSDDCWCSSASIGPADDGRVKPDLWHFYDYTRAASDSGDNNYTNFGGTSGATPIVAGHVGLVFQMWADGVFDGGPGKGRDVFNYRPHSTTVKALLIHSAYQYPFSGTSHDKTRAHQGWGMPDVKNLYQLAENNSWSLPILIDESDVITPLATKTYNITCGPSEPLKVTLVYADPPGNPSASVDRINDLTLKVTSPGGTVYWGNNGLNIGVWSTSGGTSNTIDTVENVFIESPASGSWTIQVIADEVVQDGHVETGAMDADFALVVTGGTTGSTTPVPPVANFSASATNVQAGDTVTFTDTSINTPTSWSWSFPGGTPSTSTSQNPTVTYNTTGTHNVSLTATNSAGSDDEVKNNYITVTAAPITVGNTTVYGSNTTTANRRAMPFSMPENGTIDSIAMYHTGGSGDMILAVYEGNPAPQNLLAKTATTAVSGTTGWQTVNLTSPVFVAANTDICLAWVYESNPGIHYESGSPGRYDAGEAWSGGMPATYGSSTQANYIYSIYANYTPGGTPTQYTLTTNTSGQGSISLNPTGPTYNTGTVVTVTATPDSGYQFDGWSGALSGSTNPNTITMDADKSITATFSVAPTTATVGNTSVYSSTSTSASRRAMPFTMPGGGTITSVTIYHSGGSGNLILAVYADNGSSEPGNRLAVTASTALNSAEGWQTINLTSSVHINNGETVWLAWVFESNPGIRYQTGSPGRFQSSEQWSGGMPDPFGSGSQANYLYSIYATYTPD